MRNSIAHKNRLKEFVVFHRKNQIKIEFDCIKCDVRHENSTSHHHHHVH